jgi:hypothetical protein
VTVPVDVYVEVELTGRLDSATSHVGDTFGFATTRDVTLGTLAIPKGTPGHGRLAVVQPADAKHQGILALQADSIDLPDGDTVWVNSDPRNPARGHLSDRHRRPIVVPLPIAVLGGGILTTYSGDMILEQGARFGVLTIPPRTVPAPLLTAQPAPEPSPDGSPSPSPAS